MTDPVYVATNLKKTCHLKCKDGTFLQFQDKIGKIEYCASAAAKVIEHSAYFMKLC